MTTYPERHLKTGGDPRTLADYASLRDEMNKLTHPARPDVNWPYAEKLCLSLFEQNGVELQTAAWYTLARTQLAGLYGLNEGLAIVAALVSRQWGLFWPQPVHARMDIFSALSKRLQQVIRALALSHADLSQLYQAEEHLKALGDVLQRLELKHASHLEALRTLMYNAVIRLENSHRESESTRPGSTSVPGDAVASVSLMEPGEPVKWVYTVQPEPLPNGQMGTGSSAPVKPWKAFATGMLTMLVLAGATVWGWQLMHKPDPAQNQFAATLSPLPAALSDEQLRSLRQFSPSPETGIKQTQQQLSRLALLKPDWAIRYGDSLVQQALTLWPEQAKPLAQQWQQQVSAATLPVENLYGWHQGMTQLQQLASRLNALDEQRGKYMTVSELKSAVFTMTQAFNSAVPVEEQLRQLLALPEGQPWPAAQQSQTEQRLQALITRYAVLKKQTAE
ncbi:VasL domain-containing protein [Franconibacter helveticus]|uniref:VasL domain-containing protein n=1 Tax=Franconibacter helveticus TaxID=357240 RepID=UPI00066DDBD6|nr:VasL domain-containing protein [Franconibacter helveticus]